MAAESGVERARRFREKAEHAQRQADHRRMAENCEKGVQGEEEVARLLDVLDGAGWRVLHDRCKAAGSPANIDHIAVGPPGVLVIDAKHWAGGQVHLDDRGLAHNGRRRDEVLHDVVHTTQVVATHARRAAPAVVSCGVLAFVGDAGPAQPVFHHGVTVLGADHLQRWLTDQPARLSATQVQHVASTLDAALPPRTGGSTRPLTVPTVVSAARRSTGPSRRPARSAAAPRSPRQRSGRAPRTSGTGSVVVRAALALFFVFFVLPQVLPSSTDAPEPMSDRPSLAPSVLQTPSAPVVAPR